MVLGGTGEARVLADRLADLPWVDGMISLAGRTIEPIALALPTRIGGFGGIEGLADTLKTGHFDALIDATHPYAVQISANAVDASAVSGVPLLTLMRPAWKQQIGDQWIIAENARDAVRSLDRVTGPVFLAMGRLELDAFQAIENRALVRTVDPVPLAQRRADWTYLTATGPFTLDDELALLTSHAICAIVSKNSGGAATYAKIVAARLLGIPVIMIRRPDLQNTITVHSIDAVVAWLEQRHAKRLTERAV